MTPGPRSLPVAYLRLLRPQQWYKNALVLAPWVFSGHLVDRAAAWQALAGFALFCVLSSGTYALNDAFDAQADRHHPTKKRRPVASGAIPKSVAVGLGCILLVGALVAGFLLDRAFGAIEASYILLQLLYLTVLREKFLLDLASITGGFFLRSLAGVVLVAVPLSPWLLLCTLFLALFLGLGKRRQELETLGEGAAQHRANLRHYTPAFITQAIQVTTTCLLVFYSLYTFFTDRPAMMATIPFVVYGLLRYLHLAEVHGIGGDPAALFKDAASLVNLVLWGLAVVAILYGVPETLSGWAHGFAGT